MHSIKWLAISVYFLARELVSASPSSLGTEKPYHPYPIPTIPCPKPSNPISFVVHDWQNHTHDEVDSVSFHLSTSFDDLFTLCQGEFFRHDGETPCEHRGNKYNTSFGASYTVLLGRYVFIEHLFRCSRPSRSRPIVEAVAEPQVISQHHRDIELGCNTAKSYNVSWNGSSLRWNILPAYGIPPAPYSAGPSPNGWPFASTDLESALFNTANDFLIYCSAMSPPVNHNTEENLIDPKCIQGSQGRVP
ncbi:hypothetical protein HD806DRAFT_518216 [Xylariaceae sp. AK1471]|nr:hypothetical protein HD806DRAFT_518216 [Xylariaceae sp. AK1471]